jgi:hypothetical protein
MMREIYSGTQDFIGQYVRDSLRIPRRMLKMPSIKGTANEEAWRMLRHVGFLSGARTPPEDFLSILLIPLDQALHGV